MENDRPALLRPAPAALLARSVWLADAAYLASDLREVLPRGRQHGRTRRRLWMGAGRCLSRLVGRRARELYEAAGHLKLQIVGVAEL